MRQVPDSKRINASPTKAFFINMLTRDVPVSRAILDLVDNCVDGARRERDGAGGDYIGLWIRLEVSKDKFRIVDNCGGIPVKVAREYAFRFGRPDDVVETPGSIGQFGVGMKRSFFKLGREFAVDSVASDSKFLLNVNVDRWLAEPDEQNTGNWHFEFDRVEENLIDVPFEERGTKIEIMRLREPNGENFELENFRNSLSEEICAAHSLSMDRGLVITLNGIPLRNSPQRILQSEVLKPAFLEKIIPRAEIDGLEEPPVHVKLYAGIAERNLHEGGWYIFCNGRLILGPDQTSASVWGSSHNMRVYHPDFAFFRGFAYFDCDHAALLPWTTTKTGVDVDSRVYRVIQKEMIELTRPVLEFLKGLERERREKESGERDDTPLQNTIDAAQGTRAETITASTGFIAPVLPPRPARPQYYRIQYSKPAALVDKVKKLLNVSTYTAVGEKTFEYFLKNEGE